MKLEEAYGQLAQPSMTSGMATDVARIRDALDYIPAHDRDTWLKMGMAIKSEIDEAGFDTWDTWAQPAESYKTSDAKAVWKSINAAGGVTIASLFHEAQAHGWRDNRQYTGPTPGELAERQRQAAERAEQEAAEQAQERAATAKIAAAVWGVATEAGAENPYLQRKKAAPVPNLREIDADKAAAALGYMPKSSGEALTGRLLVVPVMQGGILSTLELIDGDKRKSALPGRGSKAGGYWVTEPLPDSDGAITLLIGEGVATVLSAREATGHPAIAALSSGNLPAVARLMRERYPAAVLVLLADLVKDTGAPDPHSIEAAQAVGGILAAPDFGPGRDPGLTDFNDMAIKLGREAVAAAIAEPGGADEWPELIPLDIPDLPRLDSAQLPEWAGEFAHAISRNAETPQELAIGMILATCGAAAARRLKVLTKDSHHEPCNVWIVPVLLPGNRKSSVQDKATRPLSLWERDQAADMALEIKRITSERKTMEARAKGLRTRAAKSKNTTERQQLEEETNQLEQDLPEIPIPPQLWTSDCTPEQLGVLLAEHSECMAWLSSEGGLFDQFQGRYSKGIPNLDLLLKSHSGEPERVSRGSRPPVFLDCARLSIGLTVQPDVLQGLATAKGFRGRGLLARFLYLMPPSPLGYRTLESSPIPESVTAAYTAGVRSMLDWEPDIDQWGNEQPRLVKMSKAAYQEWKAFADAIEVQLRPGEALEQYTDWGGKAPGQAARIAGILHGIKHAHGRPWEHEINPETMTAALEIMAVFTEHSRAAIALAGIDPALAHARKVWEWVDNHQLAQFTVRDAYRALRRTFNSVTEIRASLDILAERGYLEIIEPNPLRVGRKPSPMARVRPEFEEKWR